MAGRKERLVSLRDPHGSVRKAYARKARNVVSPMQYERVSIF